MDERGREDVRGGGVKFVFFFFSTYYVPGTVECVSTYLILFGLHNKPMK